MHYAHLDMARKKASPPSDEASSKGLYVRKQDTLGRYYYLPRAGGQRVKGSLWKEERARLTQEKLTQEKPTPVSRAPLTPSREPRREQRPQVPPPPPPPTSPTPPVTPSPTPTVIPPPAPIPPVTPPVPTPPKRKRRRTPPLEAPPVPVPVPIPVEAPMISEPIQPENIPVEVAGLDFDDPFPVEGQLVYRRGAGWIWV